MCVQIGISAHADLTVDFMIAGNPSTGLKMSVSDARWIAGELSAAADRAEGYADIRESNDVGKEKEA